jgi:integrase
MNTSKFYLGKRDNGIYQIGYFVDSRLKWKSTGARTKPEALSVLKNFEKSFTKSIPSKSLSGFITEFLSFAEQNYSSGTVEIYRTALSYLSQIIGEASLSAITQRHADIYKVTRLQAFRQYSKTERIKPTTVNCELRTLRAAFNVALRWKLITDNPFRGVSLASIPETAPIFFTRADFQKLLDSIKEEWLKNIVVFAALTGMRRGEILNLRWESVDMQRKVLVLQSTASFRVKAGRRRTVPLSDSAIYLLTQIMNASQSGYVFEHRGRQIGESCLSHKFKGYVRECFSNESALHFHSLRHSIASWLVQGGSTLYEVQMLLGHSSSKMTQVYAHLLPETLHCTVNKVKFQFN